MIRRKLDSISGGGEGMGGGGSLSSGGGWGGDSYGGGGLGGSGVAGERGGNGGWGGMQRFSGNSSTGAANSMFTAEDMANLSLSLSGLDFSSLGGLNLGNVGAGLESKGWGDSYTGPSSSGVSNSGNEPWTGTPTTDYIKDGLNGLKNLVRDLANGAFGSALASGVDTVKATALALLNSGTIDIGTYNNVVSSTMDFASGKVDGVTYQSKAVGGVQAIPTIPMAAASNKTYSEGQFWNDFIDNFYGVGTTGSTNYIPSYKDLVSQDDTFKKEAINNYITKLKESGEKRIVGAGNATGRYTTAIDKITKDIASGAGNVGFGMKGAGTDGQDFKMDFTPKSVRNNRLDSADMEKNILAGNLSLEDLIYGTRTEAMGKELGFMDQLSPANAGIGYTNRLQELGQYEKDLANKIAIARTAPEQDKSTNWLKAIGDVIKIGDSGYDFYDKLFGKKEESSIWDS